MVERYVFKTFHGYPVVIDDYSATRVEITRTKRDYGIFREVEGTGKYRTDVVRLRVPSRAGGDTVISRSAAGVKARLRRLREAEAEELDAIEAQIEALREQRKAVIKRAWERGNVVRLQEVLDRCSAGGY